MLVEREQTAAFQVNEIRRHRDKLTGDVDLQLLERLEILEVLARDAFERDVADVDLVALDEVKEEVKWAFEDLELDLVIDLHASERLN